jgi:hypothetical protein
MISQPSQHQPTNHTFNVNNMNNIQVINQMAPGNQYPQNNAQSYMPTGPHTPQNYMQGNPYQMYHHMDNQPPNSLPEITKSYSMPLRPAQSFV